MLNHLSSVYAGRDTLIQRKIPTFYASLIVLFSGSVIYFLIQIFSHTEYIQDLVLLALTVLLLSLSLAFLYAGQYYLSTSLILTAILIPTSLIVWRGATLNQLKLYNMAFLQTLGFIFSVLVAGQAIQIALYGLASELICAVFFFFRLLPAAGNNPGPYITTFSVVTVLILMESIMGVLLFRLLNKTLKEIKYVAEYDDMTGLPNEYKLTLDMRSVRYGEKSGKFLFFKIENYTELLLNMGLENTLKSIIGCAETMSQFHSNPIYRITVDVLCLYVKESEGAEELMKGILLEFKFPLQIENLNIRLLMRGSLLDNSSEEINVRRDVSRGLLALYQARAEKKDFIPFESERETIWKARLNILHELSEAIADHSFSVVYQPVFDREGKVAAVESLSRWSNRRGEPVSPEVFIPMLEQSGMMSDFFLIMVSAVLNDMNRWDSLKGEFPVFINLSPELINHNFNFNRLLELIDKSGIRHYRVGFEITESGVVENDRAIESVIELLQNNRFPLALDDFGTGYSNLTRILNLPFRKIKFDRSFLKAMKKDRKYADLLELLIRHLNASGFVTVIEGIESEEEYQTLLEYGCDEFQGFYLGRPSSPGDIQI